MEKGNVIIIGGGLSGLTAASYLADIGLCVTILEQGKSYEKRSIHIANDILVGLGGAGTLSGGKLCFPPASGTVWRKTYSNMRYFKSVYSDMFSSINSISTIGNTIDTSCYEDIIQKHYCTEVVLQSEMQTFITGLLNNLSKKNVSIRCGCQVRNFLYSPNYSKVFFYNESGDNEILSCNYTIFATGRTSVPFLQKIFGVSSLSQPDLGIRLTFDRRQPAFSQIGKDIKLKRKLSGFLLRTFCVCSGGSSIKTATNNLFHYDGHFDETITNSTNLGILARSATLSGVNIAFNYLETMQKYAAADISLKDFLKYYQILAKGSCFEPLFEAIVSFILELYQVGAILQNADEVPTYIPSIDNLNPLIHTSSSFESCYPNVFITGDAAGVSRGFVQAMWTGYCAAERIVEKALCKRTKHEAV